jgi:hypothetical protein
LFEKVFESLPKYYPGFSNLTKRSRPKFDEFLNSYARVLSMLPISGLRSKIKEKKRTERDDYTKVLC